MKARFRVGWLLSAIAVLVVLFGAGWWLTRPRFLLEALDLQEEILSASEFRAAADSGLVLLRAVAGELELPSVSIAVSVQGQPVWAAVLGFSDVSRGHNAGLRTRYRAGSVSKAVTGLAAARLVEMGRLDLDAPVRHYVPSFPEKGWEITPRQLASHTGGVRHYSGIGESGFWREQFSGYHYSTVEEALEIFRNDALLFEPGTSFEYSTHGFTLLSAALEGAAAAPYPELMDSLVWSPLGMENTRLDDGRSDPDRAVPYTALNGRLVAWEGPNPSYKWAGGGIVTTPMDLVRMGGALLTDQIVSPELKNDLFTPRPLADGSPNPEGYALGWRNELRRDTLAVLHHGGSSPGGSSFLLLVPSGSVAAAAMTNLTVSNAEPLRRMVYDVAALFGNVPEVTSRTTEIGEG